MVDNNTETYCRDPDKIYSYATHTNVLCAPLERFDVPQLVAKVRDQWFYQSLCRINDGVIRIGVFRGIHAWQISNLSDQFFFCVEGRLVIEHAAGKTDVVSQQGLTVPRGMTYRISAEERCVALIVEMAGQDVLTEIPKAL